MFYSILTRILRRHAIFHLLIPLVVGLFVEAVYANIWNKVAWSHLPAHLLSADRLVLYAGILAAYVVVVGVLITSETNIGLRRLELNALALRLRGATRLFAVAPTPLEEWFDPAAQVYLATIFGERLSVQPFRYERVLLFHSRSTRTNLNSDYLDGYYAKCLIDIHKRLGIDLYFLEWNDLSALLNQLTPQQKVYIGYYPTWATLGPDWLTKVLLWPVRRRRVLKIAGGVIEDSAGVVSAFRFAKRENIVDVEVQPKARAEAYVHFVGLIKGVIYTPDDVVDPIHDFTTYY